MREIMFRGQTRRRGEQVNMAGDKLPGRWVYGGVLQGTGDYSIIYGGENLDDIEKHMVYTDTIGQYTGLTDKNGVKIFEGDIIRHYNQADNPYSYSQGVVFWNENGCEYRRTEKNSDDTWKIRPCRIYEIIGNIHDNPELIGGGQDE